MSLMIQQWGKEAQKGFDLRVIVSFTNQFLDNFLTFNLILLYMIYHINDNVLKNVRRVSTDVIDSIDSMMSVIFLMKANLTHVNTTDKASSAKDRNFNNLSLLELVLRAFVKST
ncbi:CLUMA_CG013500, isoform A [Clunio marinus]|uniref:CLUMA_CG013500, isoform A n=1 Tax=Clunio marinus TaxID=568069 RepID=A0A1J1IKD9_9DIPT|nr:CLUMA_CG013500, isoform A [Clunio marinus]